MNGEGTYTAGPGVDEHPLAGAERGRLGQCLPGRQTGEGQRRACMNVRGTRLRRRQRRVGHHVLGEAADAVLREADHHLRRRRRTA